MIKYPSKYHKRFILFAVIIAMNFMTAVPSNSDTVIDAEFNKALPPLIDDIVSFYEQYATGVRIKLSQYTPNPITEPIFKITGISLNSIDSLVGTFRDCKEESKTGTAFIFNKILFAEELKRHVQIINICVPLLR